MNHSTLSQLGEFGLIARLHRSLGQREGVRVGIGDDAAVLAALATPVITCDCLVEGVHFRRDWMTPRQIGRKAMSVNLSDIAAMKARPVAAFVTLALSERDDLGFVEELYAGLEEIARAFDFTIAGGDTSRSGGGLMLSVTLVGDCVAPVLRSGARAGDVVLATGTLGDAAAGLALLQAPEVTQDVDADARQFLLDRHLDPTARWREMTALPDGVVQAALDLSDGLAGDARHIARQSRLDVEIDTALLPISAQCHHAAQQLQHRVLDWALGGGEDYELLLCVAPQNAQFVIEAIGDATGTRVTQIGRCVASMSEPRVVLRDANGVVETPQSWTHF